MTLRCTLCPHIVRPNPCLLVGLTEDGRALMEFKEGLTLAGEHVRLSHPDHHKMQLLILQQAALMVTMRFFVPLGPAAFKARAALLREMVAHVEAWTRQAKSLIEEIDPDSTVQAPASDPPPVN